MIAHLYDPCLPSLEAASRTQLYMTKEQRRQQMSEWTEDWETTFFETQCISNACSMWPLQW